MEQRARDVEKATTLLEKLGAVPTYRDLIERLKRGVDVTAYRSPQEHEDDDDEPAAGEVDHGEGLDDVIIQGEDLDLELVRAFRAASVSPNTTFDQNMEVDPSTSSSDPTHATLAPSRTLPPTTALAPTTIATLRPTTTLATTTLRPNATLAPTTSATLFSHCEIVAASQICI